MPSDFGGRFSSIGLFVFLFGRYKAEFQTFADTLRDVHRLLKRLWLHDRDEVVRFHAELALIDLKAIMQRLFA